MRVELKPGDVLVMRAPGCLFEFRFSELDFMKVEQRTKMPRTFPFIPPDVSMTASAVMQLLGDVTIIKQTDFTHYRIHRGETVMIVPKETVKPMGEGKYIVQLDDTVAVMVPREVCTPCLADGTIF